MKLVYVFCGAGLVTCADLAFAADGPVTPRNPILVTATRTAQTADETLAPVTVISRAEIEASQAKDVIELLRFHAGIDIARNGGPGQISSVFLRGTESNHTLVLIDGVKINPGTIGGAAFYSLDPNVIDRIEIVRGPRSSLYGSDAVGGVIQIFTRRGATGTTARVFGGYGSDATRDSGVGVHHQGQAFRMGAEIADYRTDGFPTRVESEIDNGHKNTNVNAYVGTKLGAVDTELSHWRGKGTTEYLDFFLTPLSQDFLNTASALTLKTSIASMWAATVKLSQSLDRLDQKQSPDFAHTRRNTLEWQNDVQAGANHLVSVGLHSAREYTTALSFGTGFDERTGTNAVFVQDQWHAGAHSVVAAWRYTDHEDFGVHHTGDVTYGYELTPALRLHAAAGTAFRAPDATDRFGFGGNPNLEPETARNLEAGARLRLSPGSSAGANVFYNDINQLISFVDPDGFSGPIPGMNQNVDKALIRGVEAGYEINAQPWSARISAIAQDPKNRDTDRQLARRAKRSLTLSTRYQGASWSAGGNALVTSSRPDSDSPSIINPGYGIVTLLAEWRPARAWVVRGRIENVFDKAYVLADRFNTQGRAYFLQLQYSYQTQPDSSP